MALAVGTALGPYEILGKLGEGGMGEVYKARDTRLGRDVAIKVLPALAAADAERRARFEREPKAVAALNHPNIVTIHAVEEADGVPFFTMEYVDGRTLGQIIPPHGLPLEDLLRIAIPLTDAVAAAHQHGILHRDLKPANVMVSAEGRVKVLDFGLAKLKEAVLQTDGSWQPTAEATGEGRILGTVAYMSPEQAEGRPVDQRSDIFSLGVLLYEMATGQRPFKGDTSVSVMSAILKDTPGSVTDLRPDFPRDLGRIVKRALNKDPERRYQTAKDLRNDLQNLKEDLDSGELLRTSRPAAIERGRRPPWVMAGVLLVAVLLAAVGTWWASRVFTPPAEAPAAGRPFDDVTLRRLTTEEISDLAVAVSPDGRYVAYAFVENGREGLRVRQVETAATIQVVAPSEVQYFGVTFSPDGNQLYYLAYPRGSGQATLYAVPVLGGAPRRLIVDVDRGVSFSPDAARFAFFRGRPARGSSIMIANADGTGERELAARQIPNDFVFVNPAWSADGRTLAVAQYDGPGITLVMVDAKTGAVQRVGRKRWDNVTAIAWPHDQPHLVVAASDFAVADTPQLWDVSLPDGAVRRITKDIASYNRVSLTADTRTLVTVRSEWRGTIWVGSSAQPDAAARIGSVPDTLATGPVRWTPDGRIVYTADVSGNYDIWTVAPDGSDLRQLTTSPGHDVRPAVAPDGRSIAFVSNRDGHYRLWRMDADGGRQAELTNGTYDYSPLVAPDSRGVYFVSGDQPGSPLYLVPITGGQPTLLSGPRPHAPAATWHGAPATFEPIELSPDGSLIVGSYFDEHEVRSRVVVVPASNEGLVRRLNIPLTIGNRTSFAWAPDGRSITFPNTTGGAANLWRQPLDGGPPTRVTHYTGEDVIVAHAWSHDGKLLALVRGTHLRHLVMMRAVSSGR